MLLCSSLLTLKSVHLWYSYPLPPRCLQSKHSHHHFQWDHCHASSCWCGYCKHLLVIHAGKNEKRTHLECDCWTRIWLAAKSSLARASQWRRISAVSFHRYFTVFLFWDTGTGVCSFIFQARSKMILNTQRFSSAQMQYAAISWLVCVSTYEQFNSGAKIFAFCGFVLTCKRKLELATKVGNHVVLLGIVSVNGTFVSKVKPEHKQFQ